jgi:hypothetical protein
MKDHDLEDLVGIFQEDGSVKCRECMEDEDWKGLTQESIITAEDIQDGEKLFYCDYCEEKL